MPRIVIHHTFSKPLNRVFGFLAEHENHEVIFGGGVRRLADGSDNRRNGVGSARRVCVAGIPVREEIVGFAPGEWIASRIVTPTPLRRHRAEMLFTPIEIGTHLVYEVTFDTWPRPVGALAARYLERTIRRGLERVERRA